MTKQCTHFSSTIAVSVILAKLLHLNKVLSCQCLNASNVHAITEVIFNINDNSVDRQSCKMYSRRRNSCNNTVKYATDENSNTINRQRETNSSSSTSLRIGMITATNYYHTNQNGIRTSSKLNNIYILTLITPFRLPESLELIDWVFDCTTTPKGQFVLTAGRKTASGG